jgi:CheY-like chemotaxis protein
MTPAPRSLTVPHRHLKSSANVFLDVQMPEIGGFDVLDVLGDEVPGVLHFTRI